MVPDAEDRIIGSLFGGTLVARVPGTRVELKRSGGRRLSGRRARYRLYGTGAERAPSFLADTDAEAIAKAKTLLPST